MAFEKGDQVIYVDEKHEPVEREGEVKGVNETMFGDKTYQVELEDDEMVSGVGESSLREA